MNWSKLQSNHKLFGSKRLRAKNTYSKKKKKKSPTRLQKYARELNKNVPQSEVWFRELFQSYLSDHKLTLYKDKYNHIVGKYIGDVVNEGYKYVIEVDGSIHDTEIQRWKDRLRDNYLRKHGYSVIRIRAYDTSSFEDGLKQILEIRSKHINNYTK